MKIKLIELKIENFKGIKNLVIDFAKTTHISGRNGTGKTTVFDAYSWLLWDKDSSNRKDFNIKSINENGDVIHNIECKVTGIIEADGQQIELMKVYKEIWSKKRGSTQENFSGNTTDYYINSVPIKKLDYNARVGSLIDEKSFNLLSNPIYFNAILDKKERRTMLLSLIDDVDKDEILKANKDLKELDLDNYTIDELKAMAKSSMKKINDDLEDIPVRIDELIKSKADLDFESLEVIKKETEEKIKEIDDTLSNSSDSVEIITKKNAEIQEHIDKMRDIKAEVDNFNNQQVASVNAEYEKKRQAFYDTKERLEKEIENSEKDKKLIEQYIAKYQQSVDKNNENLNASRNRWIEEKSKEFNESLICPICGKEFDGDKKNEIIANFNKNKAEKLAEIERQANNIKININAAEDDIKRIKKEIDKMNAVILGDRQHLDLLGEFTETRKEPEIKQLPDDYKEHEQAIEKIKEELKSIASVDNSRLKDLKENYKRDLEQMIQKLAKKDLNAEIDKKVKLYEKTEKDLAKEYENNQRIVYLTEEYIKIYTDLVQDKINEMFKDVKFKLFDTQVNGGIVETCEATVKGVPYSDVNNAGKINAGLDIINTISKKLDASVPIFVDNAESVNKLVDTDGQIVKLFVSDDKELVVKGE